MRLLLVVAAALIDEDGRILITQRPTGKSMAGLWEFPGGKVEAGESPEAALARELKEEIDVDVDPATLVPFTFASHRYDAFHLLMPLYAVRAWTGTPTPREVADVQFVRADALADYPMPAADAPLVTAIQRAFTKAAFL
ncbi:(deoxy)nucleoside triphosphate pyrophosphohydrolase [Acuticoccus sp. M5D2P5]|uniref:(deoxy)nucleoside triphosphate pyrophosphohydrolase n=1 Tax=Acuticoccus kalidii TaxID=2910977 RepID=UPI001F3CD151|nr:(deoxy)nucleoside triphosphate pyrophosphohydrolase [Acuticoccus kalidii]MCF3934286.1 (deoxy)nucleoside triphosphate pyrophosphohydrolase [Acuticoccus kalidii]